MILLIVALILYHNDGITGIPVPSSLMLALDVEKLGSAVKTINIGAWAPAR